MPKTCVDVRSNTTSPAVLLNNEIQYDRQSPDMPASPRDASALIRSLQIAVDHYQTRMPQDKRHALRARVAGLQAHSTTASMEDVEGKMLATYCTVVTEINRWHRGAPLEHDMPRLPTEIAVHWMAILANVIELLPKNRKKVHEPFEALFDDIKRQWLRHDLDISNVRSALRHSMKSLARIGHPHADCLIKVADLLDRELDRYGTASPPTTRLFDNIYGRTFESALIAHLVEHPPEAVLKSMQQLGNALALSIERAAGNARFGYALNEVQQSIKKKPRFWHPHFSEHNRAYAAFMQLTLPCRSTDQVLKNTAIDQNPNVKRGSELLQAMLTARVKDGIDCIARPYMAVVLMNAFGLEAVHFPGKTKADQHYSSVTRAASRYTPPSSYAEGAVVSKWMPKARIAGITLAYQWPAAAAPKRAEATIRPALRCEPIFPVDERPDLSLPVQTHPGQSAETALALQNGIPYVCGASGSTNLTLHYIDEVNETARVDPRLEPIDVDHAMLGTMMFLNYDGGHSIHEVLWTVNRFESSQQPSPAMGTDVTAAPSSRFKSDYGKYIDRFSDSPATRDALGTATQHAFDVMLERRREYVDNAPFVNAVRRSAVDAPIANHTAKPHRPRWWKRR